MCRWIAYKGDPVPLEHYVTKPRHSLVSQSMAARESTASTNGDGFGLGWYGDHADPGLYREVRPAWSDENLLYLARHLRSHLFFAHVRAATGTAVTRQNCHPFACGRWLFMHNGFVGSWQRLRRKVEALISDELYASRVGTTDSEAVFLAILSRGLAGKNNQGDPVRVTASVLDDLRKLAGDEPVRFAAALSNGRDLYAFRYAVNDQANSLYYQKTASGVVVVSEPLDGAHGDWSAVPENSVVVAKSNHPVTIASLSSFASQAIRAA
jgi:ergothioneine biosynthesis protein EgtC